MQQVIDRLKQEAMRRGMQLMSNPKVMKLVSDPRLMKALTDGLAFKDRVQTGVEERLRAVAHSLRLATKDDLKDLKQAVEELEAVLAELRRHQEAAAVRDPVTPPPKV